MAKPTPELILQEIAKVENGLKVLKEQAPIAFKHSPADRSIVELMIRLFESNLDIMKLMIKE
jgi:hypothetical protein